MAWRRVAPLPTLSMTISAPKPPVAAATALTGSTSPADDRLGAEALGDVQLPAAARDREHRLGSTDDAQPRLEQPCGALPDHGDRLPWSDAELLVGLEHGRQRNEAGAVFVGDAVGDRDGVEVRHADVVGKRAVDLPAHQTAVGAEIHFARVAERTVPAEDDRVQDDPIADLQILGALPHFGDDAGRLVPLDHRQARRDLSLVDPHIRSADGRRLDADEDVLTGHDRARHVLDLQFVWRAEYRGLHSIDAVTLAHSPADRAPLRDARVAPVHAARSGATRMPVRASRRSA